MLLSSPDHPFAANNDGNEYVQCSLHVPLSWLRVVRLASAVAESGCPEYRCTAAGRSNAVSLATATMRLRYKGSLFCSSRIPWRVILFPSPALQPDYRTKSPMHRVRNMGLHVLYGWLANQRLQQL